MVKFIKTASMSLMLLLNLQIVQGAGLLKPINGNSSDLKIKSQKVDIQVDDGFVLTQVEQVFHNSSSQDLEAVYQFPVPKKASISEFTVWIDGKPVTAEVLKKQKAKKIYQAEKEKGRDVGLVEKEGYQRFEIRVSPVRAGKDTKILFAYFQTAKIDTNVGRYLYPLEEGSTDEKVNSFWTRDAQIQEYFSFTFRLRSSHPVDALRMPGFANANIQQISKNEWKLEVIRQNGQTKRPSINGDNEQSPEIAQKIQKDRFTLTQDLIVYWRLAANIPGSIDLITYKKADQIMGTFMLTVTPAMDLAPIKQGRDWIFVLDISGSMTDKYQTLADGVKRTFKLMKAQDQFRIITFNSQAQEITSGWQAVNQQNIQTVSKQLDQISPNKGTNLYAGLKAALKMLNKDQTSGIILVTDGVSNVGITEKKAFLTLLKKIDVRLFTFIMGNSANEPLLDGLTKISNGFAVNISNADDIVGKLLEVTSKLSHQSLRNVKFELNGVEAEQISPKHIGSLYRGEQLIILGRYKDGGAAEFKLTGKIGNQSKQYITEINLPREALAHPELERIWAYSQILEQQHLIDFFGDNNESKTMMTNLGLQYGLVTDYTSMLLLGDAAYIEYGIERHNQKRLEVEHKAFQRRIVQPVQSRRVDQNEPVYNRSSPSYGGGAMDWQWLLLLLPLLLNGIKQSVGAKK